MQTLEEGFLKDSIKRFRYYKELGDKTFEQLKDDDFFTNRIQRVTVSLSSFNICMEIC